MSGNNAHKVLNNVLIAGNSADFKGAGIGIIGSLNLNNVTIVENTNTTDLFDGAGIAAEFESTTVNVINSIIWGNIPNQLSNEYNSEVIISFTNIEGGHEGIENLNLNPMFVNPDYECENNNALVSDLGDCETAVQTLECDFIFAGYPISEYCPETCGLCSDELDYTLQIESPCIDAGTADIDGDGTDDITDYIGSAPDMGAFEYGTNDEIIIGDTNFDGIINVLDIVQIINHVLGNLDFNNEQSIAADYNSDGIINILDIVTIANYLLEN